MKYFMFIFMLYCFNIGHCKEWKSIKAYQKVTNKDSLSPSDWLRSDRKQNTLVWKAANSHNLKANLPAEYLTIKQRRDFYYWLHQDLKSKGHQVLWPSIAYFVSNKLRLVKVFPYGLFTKRKIKEYSKEGSSIVFNKSFVDLAVLYKSEIILKGEDALQWDKALLYKEQYIWLENIYSDIDKKTFKTIERIAKGKFLYGIVLPKEVRFKGDISKAEARYNYGLNTLRNYKRLIN